jgi:hypothetical protein
VTIKQAKKNCHHRSQHRDEQKNPQLEQVKHQDQSKLGECKQRNELSKSSVRMSKMQLSWCARCMPILLLTMNNAGAKLAALLPPQGGGLEVFNVG